MRKLTAIAIAAAAVAAGASACGKTDGTALQSRDYEVTAIAAGDEHACAVVSGEVWCWGSNSAGQAGGALPVLLAPARVEGISTATALAAGSGHTCALLSSGQVRCWGYNNYGQLGTTQVRHGGSSTTNCRPSDTDSLNTCRTATPVTVEASPGVPLTGVAALSSGHSHVCALMAAGIVKCWGENTQGNLGNGQAGGTATRSALPVDVSGIASGATAVASGLWHSCALVSGGVRCWGYNSYGQIGDGSTTLTTIPIGVTGLGSGVAAIGASYGTSLAILSNGQVQWWGSNGARLDTTFTDATAPANLSGLGAGSGATAVAAGVSYYSYVCLIVSGQVRCYGYNGAGQLGDSSYTASYPSTGVTASGLSAVTQLVSGSSFSCALADGTVWCWGVNTTGQAGHPAARVVVFDPSAVYDSWKDVTAF